VLECTDNHTGERLAAKKLPKYKHNKLPCQQAAVVGEEVATLRCLSAADPAAILRFHDVRQDESYFYIVTELCVTDLGRWLAQRSLARLSEREAAHILRQLLASLAACHRHGLAYRDVKPANLLVRRFDANGRPEVVLADFGCCRSTQGPQHSNRTSAGTPLYSAPECILGLGGREADVWSAGVLLFHLLSERFPFCNPQHNISQGEYWRRVQEQPIHFVGPAWHGVSPGALALLDRMLDRDTSRRITAAQALQDPWIAEMTSSAPHHAPAAAPAAAIPLPAGQPAMGASCSNAVSSPWHHSAASKPAELQHA
jgi:serine/threonine protein kinase